MSRPVIEKYKTTPAFNRPEPMLQHRKREVPQPIKYIQVEKYEDDSDDNNSDDNNSDDKSTEKCGCGENLCCKNIMSHIGDCSLCSQIYRKDTTVYIIIIAILLVVIALLSKKAFNI